MAQATRAPCPGRYEPPGWSGDTQPSGDMAKGLKGVSRGGAGDLRVDPYSPRASTYQGPQAEAPRRLPR